MKMVFFGLTITSSWGNGHATTYRSLCRALSRRGHEVHFIEKDLEWYRSHRDLAKPDFCRVHLYESWSENAGTLLRISRDADVIVIGSYFPDAIAATNALLQQGRGPVLFYDIDTPITLAQLRSKGATEYLDAALVPHYDAYLSFSGGPALQAIAEEFGSPCAAALYCSVDPDLYKPMTVRQEYRCDLSYLGTYAADRQTKLMELLNGAARLVPEATFIVAGPQYPEGIPWERNVQSVDHVAPPEHPSFYSSSRFTLNLTRTDMIAAGFSPSVRLFEASACGAAILSDEWQGLHHFLSPGEEILLPRDAYEVTAILRDMPEADVKRVGRAARERILQEHTAGHRATEFEAIVNKCHRGAASSVTAMA
jgi:spore maturation protein CgeB